MILPFWQSLRGYLLVLGSMARLSLQCHPAPPKTHLYFFHLQCKCSMLFDQRVTLLKKINLETSMKIFTIPRVQIQMRLPKPIVLADGVPYSDGKGSMLLQIH